MFLGLVSSVVVAFLWPDTYVSQAVMRITQQQVPEKLVPSVLNSQMTERLASMQTDILSRSSLAEIIQKPSLDLFKKERARLPMEDVVAEMRKHIGIKQLGNTPGGVDSRKFASAFTISFSYTDRYKAQAVVRELMARFTETNVTVAKNQANVTTNFLSEELKQAKEKMDTASAAITKFQVENQGRLPEQAQSNASAMQIAQMHLLNLSQSLNRAQQERTMLETQLSTLRDKQTFAEANVERTIPGAAQQTVRNEQYLNLDKELSAQTSALAALRELYGANHPDVRKQEAVLEALMKRKAVLEKEEVRPAAATTASAPIRITNPEMQKAIEDLKGEQKTTRTQIANKGLEIEEITRQQSELQKQIAGYQKRLEDAPLNERQYASLMSEFALAKQAYEEAVKKHESALTSKSIEDQKAGENLEVLDAASLPEVAAEPNRPVWAGVGSLGGLIIGLMLAAAKEVKDTSLKNLKDVRAYTNLPVLSSIPLLENALLVRRKRRLVWLAWSSAVVVGCMLMSISFYYHMTNV